MESLNANIGRNLKRWRLEHGLTLDQVADMTGVSKSMVGQIERGDSSPTVTTLWKLSSGLKLSFSALMEQPEGSTYKVSRDELDTLTDPGEVFRVMTYIPYQADRPFEMFVIELDPGARHESASHVFASQEFLLVNEGTLTVVTGEERHEISEGDLLRFDARQAHDYINESDAPARATVIITYF